MDNTPAKAHLTAVDEGNVYSQCGEDGIIEKIFATLDIHDGTAVEFGAWDGVYLCNTARLREQGWKTVLIEADPSRGDQLRKLASDRTVAIIERVESHGQHSLDSILDRHGIDAVDFLSIDIDGDDLHVLSSLKGRPKVVCIEFNPAIAPPVAFTNPPGTCKGSSLAAIDHVARELGYELVYATYCNAFFVVRALAAAFDTLDPYTAYYATPRAAVLALYDGEFQVRSAGRNALYRHPWSTVPIFVPRVPKALLGWPPTPMRVTLTYLYCCVVAPAFYLCALLREVVFQIGRPRRPRGEITRDNHSRIQRMKQSKSGR